MRKSFRIILLTLLPIALQSAAINYNQQLLDAANSGNLGQVKDALNNGAIIDARNKDKFTALHIAARDGHAKIVNLLILAKATIDAGDKDQWTPLQLAVYNSRTAVVNALISAKASIDSINNDLWTPLHFAALKDNTEVVKALILAKATIDARNIYQMTPLHFAATGCHTPVVNALLDVGADSTLLNKDKKTIFDMITKPNWINQNKKDEMTKIIKDHQEMQKYLQGDFPELIRQQTKLPLPLAKIIAEYAHSIKITDNNSRCVVQ